jgi:hypothetical protein
MGGRRSLEVTLQNRSMRSQRPGKESETQFEAFRAAAAAARSNSLRLVARALQAATLLACIAMQSFWKATRRSAS